MRPIERRRSTMRALTRQLTLLFVACAASGVDTAAIAAGQEAAPTAKAVVESAAATTAASPRQVPRIGTALGSDALDDLRGGRSVVDTEVHNDGNVDGNSADGIVSGSNFIGDGAFSNNAGISTVIQNSGSNVLIQNGTAVNVQFVDPTP
jgi:hypothetical protein